MENLNKAFAGIFLSLGLLLIPAFLFFSAPDQIWMFPSTSGGGMMPSNSFNVLTANVIYANTINATNYIGINNGGHIEDKDLIMFTSYGTNGDDRPQGTGGFYEGGADNFDFYSIMATGILPDSVMERVFSLPIYFDSRQDYQIGTSARTDGNSQRYLLIGTGDAIVNDYSYNDNSGCYVSFWFVNNGEYDHKILTDTQTCGGEQLLNDTGYSWAYTQRFILDIELNYTTRTINYYIDGGLVHSDNVSTYDFMWNYNVYAKTGIAHNGEGTDEQQIFSYFAVYNYNETQVVNPMASHHNIPIKLK